MGLSYFAWFKHMVCGTFTLLLIAGIGVGFYTVGLSIKDEKSTEVSEIDKVVKTWNSVSYSLFNATSVWILTDSLPSTALNASTTDDWTVHSEDVSTYESLIYAGEPRLFDDSYVFTEERINDSDAHEYKLVGHLNLTLEQNNRSEHYQIEIDYLKKIKHYSHICRDGYWDVRINECYYYYVLRQFCIVVNETDLTLSSYKCFEDDTNNYEAIKWNSWEVPTNFTTELYLQVRAVSDPYLYTLNEGIEELSPSRWQYWWLSVVIIIYCALLMMIPGLHFYKVFKKPKLAEQGERVEFSRI